MALTGLMQDQEIRVERDQNALGHRCVSELIRVGQPATPRLLCGLDVDSMATKCSTHWTGKMLVHEESKWLTHRGFL